MSRSRAVRAMSIASAALVLIIGLLVPTSASAVGCVGASCNNKGPVSMGCNKDGRVIAGPASMDIKVVYSPTCKAVWASSYSPPLNWCVDVQLERAHYELATLIVDGRLSVRLCPGEAGDWTNMFATGGKYFRGVWRDDDSGSVDVYLTQWVYK